MTHPTRRLALLLAIVLVLVAASAFATIYKGTATTKMVSVQALNPNGSRSPAKDPLCRAKFASLIGKVATTTYNINTTTKMMSATTTFEGASYQLSALGIASSYSFGKFFNPPQPPMNLYGVLFSLNLHGASPANSFVYILNSETNCVVSSTKEPTKAPTGTKLGI